MRELVQEFCGEYSIPIMTIHKSKGLEYHTVVFIGVEDDAFWSFST
ncbi:3'-5' exonuclease [Staphylococcus pseudintermedius]|nr:3'-5' exonuclease [Staphylococcus pseudintermedius]